MQRKRYLLPVVLGFLVLYLAAIGTCTYLVKMKYLDEFEGNFGSLQERLLTEIEKAEKENGEGRTWGRKEKQGYYSLLLSRDIMWMPDTKYQQYAAAYYDSREELEMKSKDILCFGELYYFGQSEERYRNGSYVLDDYFSREEIDRLAEYQSEIQDRWGKEKYRFVGMLTEDERLVRLVVQKIKWEENTGEIRGEEDPFTQSINYCDIMENGVSKEYVQTSGKIVWTWENPSMADVSEEELNDARLYAVFPYLRYGKKDWEQWRSSEFLQNLDAGEDADGMYGLSEYNAAFQERKEFAPSFRMDYTLPIEGEGESLHLVIATVCHPWKAAVDYMKYAYLAGFLLMVLCMGTAVYFISKSEKQRASLEENRRDFTNAMAHEMKTPLGIIRGYAENLRENTVEEKRIIIWNKLSARQRKWTQ